jgi:hypothetical protein
MSVDSPRSSSGCIERLCLNPKRAIAHIHRGDADGLECRGILLKDAVGHFCQPGHERVCIARRVDGRAQADESKPSPGIVASVWSKEGAPITQAKKTKRAMRVSDRSFIVI